MHNRRSFESDFCGIFSFCRPTAVGVSPLAPKAARCELRRPGKWKENGPDGEFNDRRLAELQFSSALATAELKKQSDHRPLRIAAGMLAGNLQPNGMWPSDQIGTIGSPITLGPFLATAQART